jgi:hypothetical protein
MIEIGANDTCTGKGNIRHVLRIRDVIPDPVPKIFNSGSLNSSFRIPDPTVNKKRDEK